MVQITRDEAMMLQKKGFQWGEMLHHTVGVGHKYYLTESYKAMKVLNNYRNSKVIATYAK